MYRVLHSQPKKTSVLLATESEPLGAINMSRPATRLAVCSLCLLALVGTRATAAFVREAVQVTVNVTVNGESCTAELPYYPIHPGQANSLTIRADVKQLDHDVLTLTLARTCPGGRSDQATEKITPEEPEAAFDLGAFAVPAEYEYEHGVVYRRGYRFRLTVADGDKHVTEFDFYQGPARAANCEALWKGDVERYVHQSGYERGQPRPVRPWTRGKKIPQPMDPPFLLQLDWAVLSDPDDVRVQFRQKDGLELEAVPATLMITRLRDGEKMLEKEVTIGAELATERPDVSQYEEGKYLIELRPNVIDTADREGPRIVYHRGDRDPSELLVSPLAPWTLTRDSAREELVISDFQDATGRWGTVPDTGKWDVGPRLLGRGDIWAEPVVLTPDLTGHYAVFASATGTCYVRAGKDPIVRRLGAIMSQVSQAGEQFLVAADMTNAEVAIYQSGTEGQGLISLRLVPVTAESVMKFREETSQPPTRLVGHCDWHDFFLPGAEPRREVDQFEALVEGHGELGMRDLQWAIGRSVVTYHSKLPDATRFPGVPLGQVDPKTLKRYPHHPTWAYMTNKHRALAEVEKYGKSHEVRIWPWLAMQRHYGGAYGGVFRSQWFASHPEWYRWQKHASKADGGAMSYFFPEVRQERVDILCELAERNVEGIVVDGGRQPPMLLYHPKMVAAYKKRTGIDPRTIDASAGKDYDDWIRWRADFFTETLRELKTRLAPIRKRRGKAVPVVLRIPSAGMLYSMAQGFDVETWCREGLIDILQLEPLEDRGGRGSHDVRPYVELGNRYQIQVMGGINANTFDHYTVIMKRAMGLLDADVDGIYFFESNQLCAMDHLRWIVPLLGNRERLAEFLKTSNIEACYPVRAGDAFAGFDNHSFGGRWNVYEGQGGRPL